MTATPYFDTGEVLEPTRISTLNYVGGSLTGSRGLMASIFASANFLSTCTSLAIERSRKSYTRTSFIGDSPTVVNQSNWTEIKYPSQTKSLAAGGEAIMIKVDGEWWTARLSGTHSAFMDFLCSSREDLRGTISWRSERGTVYGPIGSTATEDN